MQVREKTDANDGNMRHRRFRHLDGSGEGEDSPATSADGASAETAATMPCDSPPTSTDTSGEPFESCKQHERGGGGRGGGHLHHPHSIHAEQAKQKGASSIKLNKNRKNTRTEKKHIKMTHRWEPRLPRRRGSWGPRTSPRTPPATGPPLQRLLCMKK